MDSSEAVLGETSGPVTTYVDPDEVAALASALNDPNPRYRDGSAVPPTYAVVPALEVMQPLSTFVLGDELGVRSLVHGEHDLRILSPIVPGSSLRSIAQRVGARPTPAGMVVVNRIRAVDADGVLMVEQHWTSMLIGEATGEPRGEGPPGAPTADRQGRVESLTLPTTRDQAFRYAGASGDREPMHVNDAVARERGFPRKFNQGLCTLGMVAGALVDRWADGDPTLVSRLRVRFSAPVFAGDAISLDAWEFHDGAGANRTIGFEARSEGRVCLRHGLLELSGGPG